MDSNQSGNAFSTSFVTIFNEDLYLRLVFDAMNNPHATSTPTIYTFFIAKNHTAAADTTISNPLRYFYVFLSLSLYEKHNHNGVLVLYMYKNLIHPKD